MNNLLEELRAFVTDNFLFGPTAVLLEDDTSLLENGIIDSTGILELIGFVERTYNIRLYDEDLVPANLDSLDRLARFIQRKLGQNRGEEPTLAMVAEVGVDE